MLRKIRRKITMFTAKIDKEPLPETTSGVVSDAKPDNMPPPEFSPVIEIDLLPDNKSPNIEYITDADTGDLVWNGLVGCSVTDAVSAIDKKYGLAVKVTFMRWDGERNRDQEIPGGINVYRNKKSRVTCVTMQLPSDDFLKKK